MENEEIHHLTEETGDRRLVKHKNAYKNDCGMVILTWPQWLDCSLCIWPVMTTENIIMRPLKKVVYIRSRLWTFKATMVAISPRFPDSRLPSRKSPMQPL